MHGLQVTDDFDEARDRLPSDSILKQHKLRETEGREDLGALPLPLRNADEGRFPLTPESPSAQRPEALQNNHSKEESPPASPPDLIVPICVPSEEDIEAEHLAIVLPEGPPADPLHVSPRGTVEQAAMDRMKSFLREQGVDLSLEPHVLTDEYIQVAMAVFKDGKRRSFEYAASKLLASMRWR